jgi:hypothetical protein
MNWDALGAIAALLGSIGVIATLAYLSAQIRQNTAVMKVTAKQNQSALTHSLLQTATEHADVLIKWNDPESLSETEKFQSLLLARDAFRGWEFYCYLRDAGMLDNSEWEGLLISISKFAARPFMKLAYDDMRSELSPSLRRVLDPLIQSNASAT